MRNKTIYRLLAVLVLVVTLNSCVKDTDYDTPQITCDFKEADLEGTDILINTIINNWIVANDLNEDGVVDVYDGDTEIPTEFEAENTNYISGYVVSDDRTGNFYKELYIQDSPTNPTISIKVGVNVSSLFTKYDIGRKVYIYLHGLALNRSHGEMFLGQIINNQVDEMNENVANTNIFRNCEAVEVTPKIIDSPSSVNNESLGMFVQFDNMQFDLGSLELSFVNPQDDYDTHIPMTNCMDNSTIILETSAYCNFKNEIVPQGSGTVKGILTRDYGDDFYVLRVNSVNDFSFDGERCGATMLDCNNPNVGGSNVVFDDDFESYAVNQTNLPGWVNTNVNGGSELYEINSYDNNKYIQCSAYNSGETPLEVWLITPPINLDGSTDEELTFKTKTGYNNGAALSVFVSTDFTGDISSATWLMVDAEIADGPAGSYETSFTDSGSIDISCLNGDVYVAFKYLGGDGGITTTFQVDDVKVTGN